MKVTYNWLKDFVDIRISPRVLADKLTMAGLEVTSLEEREDDFIFEIEVTSNRPDWLSVVGIAREVAAITGKKLSRYPVIPLSRYPAQTGKQANRLTINIEDKRDCLLYTARIIKDIKVGPSPSWLRERLELVGCRSVNNIVDITNYLLFEWGEPLHAFDLDKLVSPLASYPVSPLQIIIRRAKKDEEIITIDGARRILSEEILVIASGNDRQTGKQATRQPGKPIAIAGVMGGKDSGVIEQTKDILLEAAVFNPLVVRRARRQLGLQSESAYRFERGVDISIVDNASWYAVDLIQKVAGGTCVLAKASGSEGAKRKKVALSVASAQKILGVNIAPTRIKKILHSLEFKTKTKAKNNFMVEVPLHRQDVHLEIDLIEEVARIHGYELIPKSLPAIKPKGVTSQIRDKVSLIKNILVGLGLNEVITYSLIDRDALKSCPTEGNNQTVEILNPSSKEQEILRPKLMPSLANCIAYNLHQQQGYVNIFEIAKVFYASSGNPQEELVLGIALCGIKSSFISGQGLLKEEAGFLHLKGILETLFAKLGIKDYNFNTQDAPSCLNLCVAGEKIGLITRLGETLLDTLDIKNKDVFILEMSLDKTFSHMQLKKYFVPLPKYPGIVRDISFILKDDILVSEILGALKGRGGALLRQARAVDFYKGKQIPAGYKGLTISCLYRAEERTLTEAEINPLHNLICDILTERFGAKMR